MENNVLSLKKTARLAGLLYLIWIILGVFGIFFISSSLIVQGDAVTTSKNIHANEFLFRIGIINDIITNTMWIFIVLIFYRMFKHINLFMAKLMVLLVIVQIPALFFMESLNIASLMAFKGNILQTFELSQRQELAMLFLKINDYGTLVSEVFWGIWLLPFGLLVYKSLFIPRVFGVFLILNCIAYVLAGFVSILFPYYQNVIFLIAMPFYILGEVSITLWLLIKGVKNNISIAEEH